MEYFDLDTEITMFECQRSKKEGFLMSVEQALYDIRDEVYSNEVEQIRNGKDSSDGWIKRNELPTAAFHGQFSGARNKVNFENPSGLIIIDIDNVKFDSLEAHKSNIMAEVDSCLACFVSPSGDGLKCLYLVDVEKVTVDTYRGIGKQLAPKFSKYGDIDTLSVTDCLIMSSDKDIIINKNAIPDIFVEIEQVSSKKKNLELEEKDPRYNLYEDAEEFFELVLVEGISALADNNYHFIQMSVLELAKFGFKSPDSDLSFIIDFSADAFKQSKENGNRLREAIEKASLYEQLKWPYNYSDPVESEIGSSYEDDTDDYGGVEDGGSPEDFEDDDDGSVDIEFDRDILYQSVIDLIEEGDRVGAEVSLSNFADVFRWRTGLTVFTGIPSHGKTEFLDQMITDLSRLHGWVHSVAGFEQSVQEHITKLMRKVVGFNITSKGADKTEMRPSFDFVTQHVHHVDVTKTGGDLKKILRVFEKHIELYGCKNFIIDPFNLISIKSRLDEQGQAKEILRMLVHFFTKHDVSIMLIAHPTKMKKDEKTGKYIMPEFYDVKGTSAFYEMAYHGLSIYRDDDDEMTPVRVKVLKVKQNSLGTARAVVYFRYERGSGRYIPVKDNGEDISGDWNEKNWHKKLKI